MCQWEGKGGVRVEIIEPITEVPDKGYVVISNILSSHVAVLFAAPSRGWNELEQSQEWRAFQALLEKLQEEYDQK